MKLLRTDSSAPDGSVIERDLCSFPLPSITDEWLATYGDAATLTVAQREYLSASDSLIASREGLR